MELVKKSVYVTLILFIISIIYTVIINIFAQTLFNKSANGSLIYEGNTIIGSEYIGQLFTSDKYFHGRPSIYNYNTYISEEKAQTLPASGGSNLAISNPQYNENLKNNIDQLLESNPHLKSEEIPIDMITSSASGLDPNISVQGAMIQVKRVAEKNNLPEAKVIDLVKSNVKNNMINVLKLNISLKEILKKIEQ